MFTPRGLDHWAQTGGGQLFVKGGIQEVVDAQVVCMIVDVDTK